MSKPSGRRSTEAIAVIRTRCYGLVGAMIPDRICCPGYRPSGGTAGFYGHLAC